MVSNMSTMKSRVDAESRSIAEQAAEWLLILEEGDPTDREQFADWLKRSPLHVGAFLRASAVDELASNLDPEKNLEVETGPFEDLTDIAPSASAARTQPQPGGFRVRTWAIAACSALLAIALVSLFTARQLSEDSWKHYSAAVGEQRILELEDGSVMYLGAGSSVDVSFTHSERRLRLVNGEAMFQVHHDASRPFQVHVGRTTVQAVGTQFSVNRVRNDSLVSVVEGIVQISREPTLVEKLAAPVGISAPHSQPVRLAAGQETRVAEDGEVSVPKAASVDPVKNWKARRLTFINETLFAIADEFNRYNRAPKIRIADSAAGELRFAAAFDANDPQSLVMVLEGNPRLNVERRGSEIVIQSK